MRRGRRKRGDHPGDIIWLECMSNRSVTHVAARRVGHFIILQMVAGVREQVFVTAMVVMHMRNDDIAHIGRVDIDCRETFGYRASNRAATLSCDCFAEAGIDNDRALVIAYDPDEVVQWHIGLVMRIAVDKVCMCFAW